MKPITREWVDKAEGDWASAQREVRARKRPNYDAACFHCQQCAEKYLKARLQEANFPFGRTHDLINLLGVVLPVEPGWSVLRPELTLLTDFAVDYRYPGNSATRAQARDAVKCCGTSAE
ncbi:MAG TPA: HEPN domain-containing protein [Blastocatellia bacterium]|nr:HEPN domain-containing protein [Blastocatellia bacterium]